MGLVGAIIEGNLECDNSQFINPEGYALNCDGLKVVGSVFLRERFKAKGEVRLPGAIINSLDCTNAHFLNPKGRALTGDWINVQSAVSLRKGFKAEGQVRFPDARIIGALFWTGVDSPEKAELDLRSARIGTLVDEQKSWPEKDKLLLHGLIYDEISNYAPRDAKSRIDWLRRQGGFWPQPYEHLAGVLRKSGQDIDAKEILIAKNEDKARMTKLTWSEWWWYRVFGRIIGYGYRPWWAAWIGLVIILLGWFFFWAGSRADVITPTKEGAYVSDDSNKGWHLSEHYPTFFAPVYSLDVFVPLVDLHQASYWLPNENRDGQLTLSKNLKLPISGKVLCYYFWFEIIAGWVLITLLVVGVTGLVRT